MDEDSKMIEHLILKGAVEIAGVAENGELLYNFTEKLKEVMPELYREHLNFVNSTLMGLWEKGFVDINILDSNPRVKLTEKALNSSEVMSLSEQDRFSLNEIRRILTQ